MAKQENDKIVEALLFATDKPLSVQTIAQILEVPHKEAEEAVETLIRRLKETGSPVTVKEIAGGYELLTLPEYSPHIKKMYKNRLVARLSKPALEVLAIIAYKQPISKQEVEAIRGVNSDGVYHTLLERKLIKITGRKEAPGRPLLYGTTKEFLQYLGINTLDDLPKLEEIQSILEKDEMVENWEERIETAKNQTMINFSNEEKEKLFSKEGFEEEAAELASKMNAQDKIDGNIESGIKTEEFELPDEGESEEWDEGAEVKQDIKNDSEEDDDDLDYEEDGDDEDYEDDFDEEDDDEDEK